jgi:hypothetical protein
MARFLLVSVVLGPRAPGRLPRSFVINLAELTMSYAHRTSSIISPQFNMNALATTTNYRLPYIKENTLVPSSVKQSTIPIKIPFNSSG